MAFPSTLCVNGRLRAKAVTCPGVALATTLPQRLRGWSSCVLMPVPHVFVVMFQILAARGALAFEDASGACGDRRAVDGPSGVDDGPHRFDGGGEPAFGGHDADVIEQVGPHASVHAVEQGAHGIGEIVPDRAFAPYARLARDDREQVRRIHLGPRRFSPHAFQRDDVPAIRIAKLDFEDAHPGLQTHRTPFRSGQIPVRVDDDGAGLVGLHAPPVARVEPDAGQGQHVVLLRFEQFPHRNAMPVVVRSGDAFARVEPYAGQRPEALGRRHRHHQIAPHEADRVLHVALLVAGIRVAEPGFEPVVRAEQGEQTGLSDRAVGVAVAHACGVVEHHHLGVMPVLSNTSNSPWHTHSAVSPGNAATQRMFEYGNDTARECTTRSMPATTALAWPKSTCALPSAHSSSAKPSDCARCSCLQRLIQRCTDEYEPVNPHSATSLSYTRVAVWRCLTGMRRSSAGHPSTMAAYPSSTSDLPGRAVFDGLGE